MANENIETYLNIITDSLNNLQEDFDFLYENVNNHPKQEEDDKKKLLEEIANLKNYIITLERKPQVKENKLIEEPNQNLLLQIENLKNQLNLAKNENLLFLSKIKSLCNENIDLKGSIRVFLRIRRTEKDTNIEVQNDKIIIHYNNKPFNFHYDKIFTPSESQEDVFRELYDIIESAYDGYKVCIFVYGQTGSGKTFTMIGTEEKPGILYRSLDMIFNIKSITEENIGNYVNVKYSCVEIYNEEFIDLNIKNGVSTKNVAHNKESICLNNFTEAQEIITKSLTSRRTEKTGCNDQSSRSHLICTIHLEIKFNSELRTGTLCFIDLAGSERINQSKVKGLRLRETLNINKSLSSLGDVFMAILRKDPHIPYRNSKLTHFLQEYFNGRSRVAMILNINGDLNYRNETVSTLRFGAKVAECKLGKVEKNVLRKL